VLTVVEDLNIFKHRLSGLITGFLGLMVYKLCFQGMEEAFRHRIIPTVAFTAHTLADTVLP